MSFSDKLDLVVRTQEPLDEEEWMRRVAGVLLCDHSRHRADDETKRKVTHDDRESS